ncbi:MAG: hypothetical protein ACKV1O_31040 [Saprospiraceae bacterium]
MKLLKLMLAGALLMIVNVLFAQTVDTTGVSTITVFTDPTLGKMINSYEAIFGALVILWGYLAKLFKLSPTLKNNFVFVVLAGGIVLGGVFIYAGWSKTLPLVFSFLSAIGIFNLILKPAGKLVSANAPLRLHTK